MMNRSLINRNHAQRSFPLEQFFESFWGASPGWSRAESGAASSASAFSPRCELSETDKEYLIQFDVPGIKESDLNVELKDGVLTISGERQKSEEQSDRVYHYSERSYGRFERSFKLPEDVDRSRIEAKHEHGTLVIVASKKEAAAALKIPIKN